MDDDLKKYLYWGLIALLSLFALYTFVQSYRYENDRKNMVLQLQKKTVNFKFLAFRGPEPFTVDMIDLSTNQELKNVVIYQNCPQYQKNQPGLVLPMVKILNVRAVTGEQFYTYEEGYDALCTNKNKNNPS